AQSSADPPDDSYDPGAPHSGGYGSGSGGGTTGSGGAPDMAGPPQCDPADRRCPHEFVYAGRGDEKTVTLIGSFDMWGPGAPMTLSSGVWRVTVNVPWDAKISYKFHITYNSAPEAWLPDPTNPTQEDDGFGGKNSVLSGVECTVWSCAAPAMPPGP